MRNNCPAPGCRDFGRTDYEGIIRFVGNSGFYWSSTTNDIYEFDLLFHSQDLVPSYTDTRAHGFPLRCLSE